MGNLGGSQLWRWDRCSSLVEMALWNRVEKYRKTPTDRVCIPLTMARHEKSGENHLDFRCSAPGAPGHWGGVGEGRDDYEFLAVHLRMRRAGYEAAKLQSGHDGPPYHESYRRQQAITISRPVLETAGAAFF